MAVAVASGLPMMASLVVLVCLCASLTASHEWQRPHAPLEERPHAMAPLEERPRAMAALEERPRPMAALEERPQAVAALEERPGRDLSPLQEFTRSNYKDFSYTNEFFEEDRQRF